MKSKIESGKVLEPLNVLLIGNNPIELGGVLEKFKQIRGQKVITEIAFDIKSVVERLIRFRPNFIFIDDNLGRSALLATVNALGNNRWTKDIPIAVLKNSNYHESLGSNRIFDYLLKQNLSPEELYNSLKSNLKVRRAQLYLYQAYKNRKRKLMEAIRQG